MCNIPSPVASCARYTANCKLNCLSASACYCRWRKYKNKTQHALICIVLPRRTLAMGNNKRAATKWQKNKIQDKLKRGKEVTRRQHERKLVEAPQMLPGKRVDLRTQWARDSERENGTAEARGRGRAAAKWTANCNWNWDWTELNRAQTQCIPNSWQTNPNPGAVFSVCQFAPVTQAVIKCRTVRAAITWPPFMPASLPVCQAGWCPSNPVSLSLSLLLPSFLGCQCCFLPPLPLQLVLLLELMALVRMAIVVAVVLSVLVVRA